MKVSAMILDVGSGYIGMGETIEERRNLLRSTCSAWNIACNPPEKREELIKKYMGEYKKYNPKIDKETCSAVEQNIRLLIKEKDKKYPDQGMQVYGSDIVDVDGKDKVTVASMQIE